MEFNNLHEYLDEVFKDRWAVSDDQIIAAKKNYWRMYNTDLKARQRSGRKEFSVWFTAEEFTQLQKYIEDLPVSDFIRQTVLTYAELSVPKPSILNNPVIEQQLVLISGLLEEALIDGLLRDPVKSDLDKILSQFKRLLCEHDCKV